MALSVEAEQRKGITVFLALFSCLGALIYGTAQPKALVWTILCFIPASLLYAYSAWGLMTELRKPFSVDLGSLYICWSLDGVLILLAFWQWLPLLILGAFPVGCMVVHTLLSCCNPVLVQPPPPSIPTRALLDEPAASDYGTLPT